MFRKQRTILIMVAALLPVSCTDSQQSEQSTLTLQSITPAAGSSLDDGAVIEANLSYKIVGMNANDTYMIGIFFKSATNDDCVGNCDVTVTNSEGTATLSYTYNASLYSASTGAVTPHQVYFDLYTNQPGANVLAQTGCTAYTN
jgi:hypothetical protein